MEKCIEDGKDYLKSTKKTITKTRTMVGTVADGKKFIAPKRAVVKKAPKKKAARRLPVRPARKSLPARPMVASSSPFPSSSGVRPAKATVFKTASRSDLPLPAYGCIDVCFCLDVTGSMGGELAQVQSTIASLIEKISNKVRTEGISLRFGIVAYRDHCDKKVLDIQDFTDPAEATRFVNSISAWGGGDAPEAAHDGLLAACQKLTWMNLPSTPMVRYIFHVLDAPPHGREFTGYEAKDGCTCGITTDSVVHEMNMKQIHYRMIKVRGGAMLDKTEQVFKGRLGNFDSVDISHAREMDVRVSDMVIHEIMPDA